MVACTNRSITTTSHDHGHEHETSSLSPLELRVRALETVLTQKGYVDPAALDVLIDTYQTKIGPAQWCTGDRARLVRSPNFAAGCSRMPRPPSPPWALRDGRASTWWPWKTRRKCTTWWCAPCAAATPGPCSGCRPPGTRARPIALERSRIPAACSRTSAFNLPSRSASASGIRPPRCAISCYRGGRRERNICARASLQNSSRATP